LPDTETLGARLLRARLGYGARQASPRVVTQLEVAKALGVSGVAVGGWEADRNEPELDNLRAIARFYGVRLGWLLEGELPMWAEPDQGGDEGEQGAKTNGPAKPKAGPTQRRFVSMPDDVKYTKASKPQKKQAPKKPGRSALAS
jgi:transcriptional regulator with XRE-family HTH domain